MKKLFTLITLILITGCEPELQRIIIYEDLTKYVDRFHEEGLQRIEGFEYPNVKVEIGVLRYPYKFETVTGRVWIDRGWYLWSSESEREILIFREIARSVYGLEYGEGVMKDPLLSELEYLEDREGYLNVFFGDITD